MANENVNHVVINGVTKLDLRSDTVTPSTLMLGYTAHDASGAAITGTATGGGIEAGTVYQDADGYLVLDDEAGSSVTVEALSVTANGTYTAPTGTAYSPVTVSVSGGGGDTWSWMGRNPTRLRRYTEHLTFADLGADDWTWSTTASVLRDSTNISPTLTVDVKDYDLIVLVETNAVYNYGGWDAPTRALDNAAQIYSYCAVCIDVNSTVPTIDGSNTNAIWSSRKYLYYNASGSLANVNGGTSNSVTVAGVSMTGSYAPSTSKAGTSTTLTFKKPVISIKGDSNYFSETAFSNLDCDASYIDVKIDVYRVDAGTTFIRNIITDELRGIIDNGLGVS